MKTIETITVLPLSKKERINYVEYVVNEFNEMNDSEQLKLAQQIKIAIEVFENILKHNDVRSALISRMDNKQSENEIGTVKLSERKTYSFGHCQMHNDLKERLKTLENIMKSIKEPVADTETGEIIEPAQFKVTEVLTFNNK